MKNKPRKSHICIIGVPKEEKLKEWSKNQIFNTIKKKKTIKEDLNIHIERVHWVPEQNDPGQ